MFGKVDPDIRKARTLGASFYADVHREILRRSWHVAAPLAAEVGSVAPFALGDTPLVLARGDRVRCLSNVCTHRANLVVESATCVKSLRCRYHGRRFSLDGKFVSMPEFEGAEDFPSADDDLPEISLGALGPVYFASIDPSLDFETLAAPLRERARAWDVLSFAGAREYDVAAHWALYVENYLEGFHIPFVHADLNEAIDYGTYRTETFDWGSVQIAESAGAYYFWLFPTTMINVYSWGISVNAVRPISAERTKVAFFTWALRSERKGASADLHQVEVEDEAIVENVQRGIRSPLYRGGRYSPAREIGVHHFHRLLSLFGGD